MITELRDLALRLYAEGAEAGDFSVTVTVNNRNGERAIRNAMAADIRTMALVEMTLAETMEAGTTRVAGMEVRLQRAGLS